jgi:hypothetical protein
VRAPSNCGLSLSATLRREQTLQELMRLGAELGTWREHRMQADCDPAGNYRGQYETQRETIVAEVRTAIEAVEEETRKLSSATGLPSELYERLARIDRQIIWVRYAWDFYRSRFDQRDDPVLAATLKAADEVSWSCFKPLFSRHGSKRPAAPLPCIDFDYTPSTLLTTQAHVLRREAEDEGESWQRGFETLPVPLLRLPPTVVSAPWNLALIAHEVGHAVFAHVVPGSDFRKTFPDLIEAAVHNAGATTEEMARWRSWSSEIFADCYAVLMMGPWALWPIGQLEYGTASQMSARRPSYPPANVRLYLIAQFAAALGLEAAWEPLGKFGLSEEELMGSSRMTAREAAVAREVAKLSHSELPQRQQSLVEAVRFDIGDFQRGAGGGKAPIEQWRDALLGSSQKADEHELRTSRLVNAGAVRASIELAERAAQADRPDPSDELRAQKLSLDLQKLRQVTLERITACAEAGKRAAIVPDDRRADALARHILQATNDQLLAV